MPFDAAPTETTDDVLRILYGLRELHSDPARWCNTGSGLGTDASCISVGVGRVAIDLGVHNDPRGLRKALFGALPPEARGDIIRFNERMGTTHAELMEFYDRAIALRLAELAA